MTLRSRYELFFMAAMLLGMWASVATAVTNTSSMFLEDWETGTIAGNGWSPDNGAIVPGNIGGEGTKVWEVSGWINRTDLVVEPIGNRWTVEFDFQADIRNNGFFSLPLQFGQNISPYFCNVRYKIAGVGSDYPSHRFDLLMDADGDSDFEIIVTALSDQIAYHFVDILTVGNTTHHLTIMQSNGVVVYQGELNFKSPIVAAIPFHRFEFGAFSGSTYGVYLDNIRVASSSTVPPPTYCGEAATEYFSGDLNQDCYVNLKDFAEIVALHSRLDDNVNQRMEQSLLENGPADGNGDTIYGVKVVSGTTKIRPKGFYSLEGQPLSDSILINAARNEYENKQVVVYSPSQSLTNTQLEASNLVSAGGTILASNIMFCPVGYIKHDTSAAWWPDPLLDFLATFNIQQSDVQSLWYRVHVPSGTPAGAYSGTVTIRPGNAPDYVVPVEVNVWDIDLPLMSYLPVMVGGGSTNHMDYKINPGSIYEWNPTHSSVDMFDEWYARGVTAWNVHYVDPSVLDPVTKLPTGAHLDQWVAEVNDRLVAAEAAGIRDQAYFYMFDESSSTWWPAMRMISDRFYAEFPDLRQLTTAHDSSFGVSSNLPHLNWCPHVGTYDLAATQVGRAAGKEIWWYTCDGDWRRTPYPNVLLEDPSTEHRVLMGFMAMAYETDGFLYFMINYRVTYQPPITTGPYTSWLAPNHGNGQLQQMGPGGSYPDDLLPSIRLENIRDGLEDYDLLHLAQQQMIARGEPGAAIGVYYGPGNAIVESRTAYSQKPMDIEAAREMLANYILSE